MLLYCCCGAVLRRVVVLSLVPEIRLQRPKINEFCPRFDKSQYRQLAIWAYWFLHGAQNQNHYNYAKRIHLNSEPSVVLNLSRLRLPLRHYAVVLCQK